LKLVESLPEDLENNKLHAIAKQESDDSDEPANMINAVVGDVVFETTKTSEELIDRARLQANLLQNQLQKDLDTLAAKAVAEGGRSNA